MNRFVLGMLGGALAVSAQAPPPPPEPHTATVAAGRLLTVRTAEPLSSRRSHKDDVFIATLDQRLLIDGFVIAERDSRCEGRVVDAAKIKGGTQLTLELTKITTTDGQMVNIHTAPFVRKELTSRERDFGLPPRSSVPFKIDRPVTITERVPVR
jgi:hypothetical protein